MVLAGYTLSPTLHRVALAALPLYSGKVPKSYLPGLLPWEPLPHILGGLGLPRSTCHTLTYLTYLPTCTIRVSKSPAVPTEHNPLAVRFYNKLIALNCRLLALVDIIRLWPTLRFCQPSHESLGHLRPSRNHLLPLSTMV